MDKRIIFKSETEKNNYHRFLKLPFEIKKPSLMYENHDDEMYKHFFYKEIFDYNSSEMEKLLNEVNLKISHIFILYTPPGGELVIHSDSDDPLQPYIKINMTWAPEGSTVRWWKTSEVPKFNFLSDWNDKATYDKNNSTMIYEVNTTEKPSLVETGSLHSTWNPNPDMARWTLCFDICHNSDKALTWDESLIYLEKYIE